MVTAWLAERRKALAALLAPAVVILAGRFLGLTISADTAGVAILSIIEALVVHTVPNSCTSSPPPANEAPPSAP